MDKQPSELLVPMRVMDAAIESLFSKSVSHSVYNLVIGAASIEFQAEPKMMLADALRPAWEDIKLAVKATGSDAEIELPDSTSEVAVALCSIRITAKFSDGPSFITFYLFDGMRPDSESVFIKPSLHFVKHVLSGR